MMWRVQLPLRETEGEHRKGVVASGWGPSGGLRPRDPTWMPPLGPESPRALLWTEGGGEFMGSESRRESQPQTPRATGPTEA